MWSFRARQSEAMEKPSAAPSGSPIANKGTTMTPRKYKRRLVLSQTLVIDADLNKRSLYAETAHVNLFLLHQ